MTTTTSSATTPSPPMAFLHTTPVSLVATIGSGDIDATEREARQQAIRRFLARAEISKLTRGLRARLSYATYKATHNVAHLPIGDLESHVRDDALAMWAPSRNIYNDGSGLQGNNIIHASSGTARKGAMAPPTTIPSSNSRSHQASPGKRESMSANAAHSLYASILAPPPAKHVCPTLKEQGTLFRAQLLNLSLTQVWRNTHAPHPNGQGPQAQNANKRGKAGNQHRDVNTSNVNSSHDVDVDMKAAATLTRLLHHSRNSITSLSAISPRSSLSAGSDLGSTHSLSQFAQSSARTTTAQTSLASSQELSQAGSIARPATPPHSSDTRLGSRTNSFPEGGSASATDQEAIKLYISCMNLLPPLDRVLFVVGMVKTQRPSEHCGPSEIPSAYRMLTRDDSSSSISSSALELPATQPLTRQPTLVVDPPVGDVELPQHSDPAASAGINTDVPPMTKVTPPTPIESSNVTQLLPLPSSPQRTTQTSLSSQSLSPLSEHKAHHAAPATPGTYTFNLNDFINVSPSPAGPHRTTAPYNQNLSGMRSAGGRKLFAEEQAEHLIGVEETSRMGEHPNTALGAGIHLTRF
ncbi:hypothetical protein BJV77DRAFT_1066185 [Russula vinacea]|nr:hypothetical protein BJV77DRAFT_1066185 [Russula vinacea]